MNYLKLLFFIGLVITFTKSEAQLVDKIGGVCFRIDDTQSPSNLKALDSIFSKHGKRFTYSPNTQIANFTQSADFWTTLKFLQVRGHEIGDHTPNHFTQFFDILTSDSIKFINRAGIDHLKIVNAIPVNGTRVCLKYNLLNPNGNGDETNVSINNNMIISQNDGEFSNLKLYGSGKNTIYFYLPTLDKIVSFYGISNLNSNDPDTLNIKSFWNEDIDLGIFSNIPYKKLGNFDVDIDKEGFRIMLQFSLDIFKSKGINPPTVWIQPSGETPYLSKKYIADICGTEFGYLSAATYPGTIKGYNETDNEKNNSYGMQWQDFDEENQTVDQIKSIIVDRFARHTLSFGSNHLGILGANFPLNTIIKNMDEILGWCVENNIPVYTYSEWSNLIYKSQTNPEKNILPPLQNDFNKDGLVDGYSVMNGLDTISGISQSNYRAITAFSDQTMFQITNLSGVESGPNVLSFYSKGAAGNKISFFVEFPELNKFESFELPATNNSYSYQTYTFNVPKGVNVVSITCSSKIAIGSISITGMGLKGSNKPYVKLPILKRMANENFPKINLKSFTVDRFNTVNNIQWSVINNSIFVTDINANSDLSVSIGEGINAFWIGSDSIQIIAKSVNNSDTVWLYIQSLESRICADQRLAINYTFNANDSLLIWSSIPANTDVSSNLGTELIVYPSDFTNYNLKVIKRGGAQFNNSIYINVVPTIFAGNKLISRGFLSNSNITVPIDIPFYSTGLITKTPKRPYLFINENEINFTKGFIVGSDTMIYKLTTKSCEARTLTILTNDLITNLKEISNNGITVFPNPFVNELNIDFGQKNNSLELMIIDLLGNVFLKKTIVNEKQIQLDTDFLTNGIYIVKIENKEMGKTYFKKIIKQ
jgi:hypothetical protein